MTENETGEPNIVPVKIGDEMRNSYIDYAMSVIIGRALPDVRDGLKPVHRRILFGQHELSNTFNRKHMKSARIVGEVMGKYHPHGDASIYDALVRMAQDFSMRMPLVDGQGNFGSVDGDPAAAMRYTEARMTRLASEILSDLDKETVDFGPNYDSTTFEPLVLPARFPNLLVNGSEGIAVGMATKIPPHNIGEVLSACIHLVDHPDATVEDLMRHVPGPDFPTAGFMYGLNGVRDAYTSGRGVVRIRARTNIESDDRTGKDTIIVTELPYQVNKARLLEKIAELVRDKSIDGITDLRDESDRRGMRMVIELRRDVNAQVMLNQLFKRTQLEVSFGINMLAIVGGQPKVLGLKDVLGHFLDFRRDVVARRSIFERRKAQERLHILEALKKALDMVDEVIRTIRASDDAEEANARLCVLLEIDQVQATAILQMRLQRLTNLEIHKLVEEMDQLRAEIARLDAILAHEHEMMRVIRGELEEILSAYRDTRRTEILNVSGELTIEDLISNEDEVVTLSHEGYIKRTLLTEYRTQKRGGKGLRGMGTKDADFVENVWVTRTHASLLIFTSTGKVYLLKVHGLPAGQRHGKGKPIINLIPVEPDERVQAVLPFDAFEHGPFIITATRNGLIKKTPLVAYRNVYANGIIGVRVPEGDELIGVSMCRAGDRVHLVSREGQAITFDQAAARATGRVSQGVRGIRLREGDEVVSMVVLPREELVLAGLMSPERLAELEASDAVMKEQPPGDEEDDDGVELEAEEEVLVEVADDEVDVDDVDDAARTILAITHKGYGKRTRIRDYPVQNRGGLGVITIKTTDRNGPVAASRLVSEDDQIIVMTNTGKIIRTMVKGISILSRNTQGVRLITLDDDERVAGVARYEVTEEEEGAEDDTTNGAPESGTDESSIDASQAVPIDGEDADTSWATSADTDADDPDAE